MFLLTSPLKEGDVLLQWKKVFVVLALDCQFCWKKKDVTKSSPGSSIISNSSIPSKIVILSSQTEYQYTKCSVELKDW